MAVSFATDILPLFRQNPDINHMRFRFDLSSYDDVKAHATVILGRLNGTGGNQMPPAADGGPWPAANIALFQTWINEGCQP